MDSSALDSSALDSSALDSSALDSSALDSSALDSSALDSSALDREQVGALGGKAVAAGRAAQPSAHPRHRVLSGPAGVVTARGQPEGTAGLSGGAGGGRQQRPPVPRGWDAQDL